MEAPFHISKYLSYNQANELLNKINLSSYLGKCTYIMTCVGEAETFLYPQGSYSWFNQIETRQISRT